MASAFDKFIFYSVIDVSDSCYRLFGSTDHTIVKGFGMNDRVNSCLDVTGAVHDNGNISGPNADCRFSGRICSLYHSRTACCQDNVNRSHQFVGKFQSGFFYPADDSFRSTCFYCCFQNDLCSLNGTFLCTGVRADDDGVPCLQADQTFEDGSGSRVSGRNNGAYNTYRLCNFLNSIGSILFNHAAGFCPFICIVCILCCIMIFDNFVFCNAHSGFFTGKLCKWNTLFICSHSSLKKDFVYLFLSESSKFFLSFFHGSNFRL